MACVAKYVLAISALHFETIPESVQQLKTFVEKVDRYSDEVCRMLPLDTVLADMDILLQKIIGGAR
jgi:hypothetical protein